MPVPGLPRYLTRERETRLDGKGGATFFKCFSVLSGERFTAPKGDVELA